MDGPVEERIVHVTADGTESWDVEVDPGSFVRLIAPAGTDRLVTLRRTNGASSSDLRILDRDTGETVCTTTISGDPSALLDVLVVDDVAHVIYHDLWARVRLLGD
jgi:hypothetical protein